MNPFIKTLEKINNNLNLPQPQKSQILLEIAGDLLDLYHYYLNQGYSEKEAKQKAEIKIDLDRNSIAEMFNLHNSGFRKLFTRLSQQTQTKWEQVGILAVLVVIFSLFSFSVSTTQFLTNSTFLIRPLFLITVLIIVLFILKFYQLFIKKDHRPAKLRTGLPGILLLGFFSLFYSIFAYFVDMYSLGAKASLFVMNPFLMIVLHTDQPEQMEILEKVANWYLSSSSIIMTGFVVSILAAFLWYVIYVKVIKIEIAESAFLLEE
jgi:hypothetical protein